jgi:hypothetical protein
MNTFPLSHTIRYTSTGPGSVTSPAPWSLAQACVFPSRSTVTDDTPARNGIRSIGTPSASTNPTGAALAGAGAGGGISVLNIEHALKAKAHDTSSNRFMEDSWIRK